MEPNLLTRSAGVLACDIPHIRLRQTWKDVGGFLEEDVAGEDARPTIKIIFAPQARFIGHPTRHQGIGAQAWPKSLYAERRRPINLLNAERRRPRLRYVVAGEDARPTRFIYLRGAQASPPAIFRTFARCKRWKDAGGFLEEDVAGEDARPTRCWDGWRAGTPALQPKSLSLPALQSI